MYLVINKETHDIEEFIVFWSNCYKYKLESYYTENIDIELSNDSLFNLFIWKNGMNFQKNVNKYNSFHYNVISIYDKVKLWKTDFKIDDYLEISEIKEWNNIVWKIFLLHCFRPNEFPIYDQHVHRAFDFIINGNYEKPEFYYSTNKIQEKIEFYKNDYIPFIKDLSMKSGRNLKQIDEALVTFGKFLNDYNY
mgnify:CR=1 FL=1